MILREGKFDKRSSGTEFLNAGGDGGLPLSSNGVVGRDVGAEVDAEGFQIH